MSSRESLLSSPKPLLRGWSHAAGAVAALIATVILLIQTFGDYPRFFALLVFGLSMILLYAVSAIYHIGNWPERQRIFWRTFDHANIFIFIAGAYTPIAVIVLDGTMRIAMLVLIWTLALVGAAASFFTLRMPRWGLILLYIGMGWISLILLPQIVQAISFQPVLLLIAGGLSYTIGALIYAFRWPNPLPTIFGFHEIFHLLVIAGTVAIATTIWIWVLPLA